MSGQDEFAAQVHDALVHLYDAPYLEEHPFAQWLAPMAESESPGRVLRRLLLDAIQELKPPPNTPPETQAASRYQLLYLRYVRNRPMAQVATRLCITDRQAYRRQRDALDAVSAVLRRRLQVPRQDSPIPDEWTTARPGDTPTADLHLEVNRIGTARPVAPTDLAQVLESALTTVGNLAQADGRAIVVDTQPGLPFVAVDRTAIRQAIVNVLVLAIESSADGDIHVTLEGSAAEARLRISAQCGGRSALALSRRLESDSNMGVSRRLVELQGGHFGWRISGASLDITLGLPVAQHRTVLVVDDNADTLKLFARYLEGSGHHVVTATTGEQALKSIAESRPDAVVLDVMLPSADGWEVLHSLRSRPQTADIPVVVCTVLKQHGLAKSLGATEFVSKPVTQGALLSALDRCWRQGR